MNEGQNGIFSGLANSDANNQSNFGLQTNNSANLQSGFASQANNGANTQPNFSSQPNSGVASQPNFAPQTPVVGPSGGDIILGGKDSRKSHKWLIFLALGIVLVAVIAIIAIIFVTKNSDEDAEAGATNTAFSQFASFITTENENGTFPTEEYDSSAYYALERAVIDHDEEYFETANRLFGTFASEANPAAGSSAESVVNFYKTDWPMVYAYGKYHFYSEEDFLNYYLKNGATATKELITAEHQAYVATSHESANIVAEAYLAYAEYLLNSMDIIENAGCIADGKVDDTCVKSVAVSQAQIDTATKVLTDKDAADQIMQSLIKNFVQELWTFTEVASNE